MKGKFYLNINDYSGLELIDEEWNIIWKGDEEDIGIEFIEDTEMWEDGYTEKINNFFLKEFGIAAEQIEIW